MRQSVWLLASVVLASVVGAQQKPISLTYQRDILDARTIAVVAYSSSQLGAQNIQENERARLEVQTALLNWGKYQVADTDTADLIVVVRKGQRPGVNRRWYNQPGTGSFLPWRLRNKHFDSSRAKPAAQPNRIIATDFAPATRLRSRLGGGPSGDLPWAQAASR